MARTGTDVPEIQVTSPAFEEAGMIPAKYTCDGEDVSPPLRWGSLPQGTQSIALIADDPDAPLGTFVHWVLYGLPAGTQELPESVPGDRELPSGARHGVNDFGKVAYGGPCPPRGVHRYFFKVYALDTKPTLPAGKSKAELLKAMEGHILARGQIMGRYRRQ